MSVKNATFSSSSISSETYSPKERVVSGQSSNPTNGVNLIFRSFSEEKNRLEMLFSAQKKPLERKFECFKKDLSLIDSVIQSIPKIKISSLLADSEDPKIYKIYQMSPSLLKPLFPKSSDSSSTSSTNSNSKEMTTPEECIESEDTAKEKEPPVKRTLVFLDAEPSFGSRSDSCPPSLSASRAIEESFDRDVRSLVDMHERETGLIEKAKKRCHLVFYKAIYGIQLLSNLLPTIDAALKKAALPGGPLEKSDLYGMTKTTVVTYMGIEKGSVKKDGTATCWISHSKNITYVDEEGKEQNAGRSLNTKIDIFKDNLTEGTVLEMDNNYKGKIVHEIAIASQIAVTMINKSATSYFHAGTFEEALNLERYTYIQKFPNDLSKEASQFLLGPQKPSANP